MGLLFVDKRPIIEELIDLFENAPRSGWEKDEPEGQRYIIISDVLAKKIASELKREKP